MTLVAAFNSRVPVLKDADYEKVEIGVCDVKNIQNCKGVSDFWMRSILNHQLGDTVKEKDRPILGYLANIELDLHKDDKGFDLKFTFLKNSYFNETTITKTCMINAAG